MREFLKVLFVAFIVVGCWLSTYCQINLYSYPRISPVSETYQLKVNGRDCFVYATSAGDFAAFSSEGMVNLELTTSLPVIGNLKILPSRLQVEAKVKENRAQFSLKPGQKVLVEIPNGKKLFIYADSLNADALESENTLRFSAGQVYEVGELELKEGQTIHIEGGAIVRGNIRATGLRSGRITGNGILDGGYYASDSYHPKTILIEGCRDLTIEDIIVIEPQSWTIMLYQSSGIRISNVKELTTGLGSDGLDIVGCKNVVVDGCIFANGDDGIAIKSFRDRRYRDGLKKTWSGVDSIWVTNSSFQANIGGRPFEIGHELHLSEGPVRNIQFSNCDVLGVHGQGAAFGIHAYDGAPVYNVVFENIRVDHYYNQLIDFRISESRFSEDTIRAEVYNVTLRNIDVHVSKYNPGYSLSVIGGYDKNHQIRNVTFENFRMNGIKVTHPDDMDLYLKQTQNVRFK